MREDVFTYDIELCNSMSDATAVASNASVLSCVSSSDIGDEKRTIGHLLKSEKAKRQKIRRIRQLRKKTIYQSVTDQELQKAYFT